MQDFAVIAIPLLFALNFVAILAKAKHQVFEGLDLTKKPNYIVEGFPAIDQIFSEEDLFDFVNQEYDETQIGGGIVGVFDADMDDLHPILQQSDSSFSKGDLVPKAVREFLQIAYELRNLGFRFALGTSSELLEHFKIEEYGIFVFKPPTYVSKELSEENYVSYTEALDSELLKKFIIENSLPMLGRITEENELQYLSQSKPVFAFILEIDHEHGLNKSLRKLLREIAYRYPEGIFAVVDKFEASMILTHFRTDAFGLVEDEIIEDKFIALVCIDPVEGSKYYLHAETVSEKSINQFVRQILHSNGEGELVAKVMNPLPKDEL